LDARTDETRYLKLIVGGNDDGRYPGFNGQFLRLQFLEKFVDDLNGA
jgi:hypothetical protein